MTATCTGVQGKTPSGAGHPKPPVANVKLGSCDAVLGHAEPVTDRVTGSFF
jgi:hypothetical protein